MTHILIIEKPRSHNQHKTNEIKKLLKKHYKLVSVRTSSNHIEVLIHDKMEDIDVKTIETIIGTKILDYQKIQEKTIKRKKFSKHLSEFAEMFDQERFWEAHEILEELWRHNKDSCLRALINLAAAFIKLQEQNLEGHVKIIRNTKKLLQECNGIKNGVNYDCIKEENKNAFSEQRFPKISKCISTT